MVISSAREEIETLCRPITNTEEANELIADLGKLIYFAEHNKIDFITDKHLKHLQERITRMQDMVDYLSDLRYKIMTAIIRDEANTDI